MFPYNTSYSQDKSDLGYEINANNIAEIKRHCVPLITQRPNINKNDKNDLFENLAKKGKLRKG